MATTTYPNQFTNSPLIHFTKSVGDSTFKQMIQATIEHTIHTLVPEMVFHHRTLNVVLTRAQTGSTGGYLKVRASASQGVHLAKPMELMVNIGKGSLQATIIHETIHWLQYQLKILSVAYLNGAYKGGSTYLWDNATGALLNARGHDEAVLNMMTEGRTWRTEAHTTTGEGVTAYRGSNPRTGALSRMKYFLEPCERQAHRLSIIVAKRMVTALNLKEADIDGLRAMKMRSLDARNDYYDTRPRSPRTETWTVVHI